MKLNEGSSPSVGQSLSHSIPSVNRQSVGVQSSQQISKGPKKTQNKTEYS